MKQLLLQQFIEFGLAWLIGFALGLERAMAGSENPYAGTSDFIMFALMGAVSGYVAELLGNSWLIYMALPIIVMGATGILLAVGFSMQTKKEEELEQLAMQLDNPFCLKSAVTFELIFSCILMLTRLATSYLGDTWLPLVAVVSGLVDADAIAFSLSDAQKAGIISLDWASFNLVLGALSNTVVKLFFAHMLGHRNLFKQVSLSFLVISIVGIVTTFFYYDLW